jgi:hypothetical protein
MLDLPLIGAAPQRLEALFANPSAWRAGARCRAGAQSRGTTGGLDTEPPNCNHPHSWPSSPFAGQPTASLLDNNGAAIGVRRSSALRQYWGTG